MLPFQIHLHQALEALEANDLTTARARAERFFEEIDSHPIALDLAGSNSRRELFEPYYFGTLAPDRCLGYEILAHIALQSGQYDRALDMCNKSLEIIDSFLGRTRDSDSHYRLPHFPQTQSTVFSIFSKTAHLMSLAYGGKGDRSQADRWQNMFQSSLADDHQPDLVWERWLSETDDALPYVDFFEWELADKIYDGQVWMTNIGRRAHEDLDIARAPYCLTVSIDNRQASKKGKQVAWEHWALRNAIDARMIEHDLGRRLLDAYNARERRLVYYCYEIDRVESMLEPIQKAAGETLDFAIKIDHDPSWAIYQNWGGPRLIGPRSDDATGNDASRLASELKPFAQGPISDSGAAARIVCSIGENIAAANERIYTLTWVIEHLLPGLDLQSRLFCLDYFDDLLERCGKEQINRSLLLAIWKVGELDKTGERRRQWWLSLRQSPDLKTAINAYYIEFAMAAEALAAKDPDIALAILETINDILPQVPIDSYRASVAAKLGSLDLMDYAITEMRAANHTPPTSINGLIEKANLVFDMDPVLASDLLAQASDMTILMPSLFERAQTIGNIARSANRIAPQMVPQLCRIGLEISEQLARQNPDPNRWFDYSGPNFAAWIAVDMGGHMISQAVNTHETSDLLFAIQTFERAIALLQIDPDNFQMLFHVSRIAQSLGELTDWQQDHALINLIDSLLAKIWQVCASTEFFEAQNLRVVEQALTPLAVIIKADSSKAEQNIDTIFDICRSPGLPEKIIEALCFIARTFEQCARPLLEAARDLIDDCSSPYLKAISAGYILDSDLQKRLPEQLRTDLKKVAETNFALMTDLNAKIDYLIERVRRSPSQDAHDLLLQAETMALAHEDIMPSQKMLEKLSLLDSRTNAPVYLRFLLKAHKYPRLGESLIQWANGLEERKTDIFWPS